MKMTKIYKPNFSKAEMKAYELLKSSKANDFPIKVKKLKKLFPNLKIRKYTWLANKRGWTIEEVCNFTDSEDGCCWYIRETNEYMILYNDTIENEGRIRWTIAHEIGHFILKHNEVTQKTILARYSLTNSEYEVYEKEANCFARTLLAPPNIVSELNPTDPSIISDIFNISYEAATNVFNYFQNGLRMSFSYSKEHFVIKMFKRFIFKYRHGKTCSDCFHFFIDKDGHFCPVCGQSNLIKGEGGNMFYSKIELNELLMPTECPKCKNGNVGGDYCQVCGVYQINRCTGFREEDHNQFQYQQHITWHTHDEGCGNVLEGDARFCSKCGSTSIYYEENLLKNWEVEMKEKEELVDPFDESLFNSPKKQMVVVNSSKDISDEDLPF